MDFYYSTLLFTCTIRLYIQYCSVTSDDLHADCGQSRRRATSSSIGTPTSLWRGKCRGGRLLAIFDRSCVCLLSGVILRMLLRPHRTSGWSSPRHIEKCVRNTCWASIMHSRGSLPGYSLITKASGCTGELQPIRELACQTARRTPNMQEVNKCSPLPGTPSRRNIARTKCRVAGRAGHFVECSGTRALLITMSGYLQILIWRKWSCPKREMYCIPLVTEL